MDGGCERFLQIKGLRRPQGCKFRIQCGDDSGRDVHTRYLPPDRLADFHDCIFDKPKVNVLSNETNFPNSTGPVCDSSRKNSREARISGFEVMNQTSTRSKEKPRIESVQSHRHNE